MLNILCQIRDALLNCKCDQQTASTGCTYLGHGCVSLGPGPGVSCSRLTWTINPSDIQGPSPVGIAIVLAGNDGVLYPYEFVVPVLQTGLSAGDVIGQLCEILRVQFATLSPAMSLEDLQCTNGQIVMTFCHCPGIEGFQTYTLIFDGNTDDGIAVGPAGGGQNVEGPVPCGPEIIGNREWWLCDGKVLEYAFSEVGLNNPGVDEPFNTYDPEEIPEIVNRLRACPCCEVNGPETSPTAEFVCPELVMEETCGVVGYAYVSAEGEIVNQCGGVGVQRRGAGRYAVTPPTGAVVMTGTVLEAYGSRDSVDLRLEGPLGPYHITEGDNGTAANIPRDRAAVLTFYGVKKTPVKLTCQEERNEAANVAAKTQRWTDEK